MATTSPPTSGGTAARVLKRILVGRPHPSYRLEQTLLPKTLALPIFASDALSSNAYATEEILVVLLAASIASRHLVMPITIAIAAVLAIVVASYVQLCRGYPSGGGAYIVAKDNLGTLPALIAAGALLVDYVLTVAVSVVAGMVAIVGALTSLGHLTVELSLLIVVLLTLANLRGVRETGLLFAFPTYAFIASIITMMIVGLIECATSGCPSAVGQHVQPIATLSRSTGPVALFVLLHAFSSGATALTGTEAISNAIPGFKRPQWKNAQQTLIMMGVISITMFVGISFLSTRIHGVVPPAPGQRSVVGQIAHAVFGGGLGFYAVQIFTAGILVLAANTAYQGFPRLLAILAQDRFAPRQLRNLGDRLVYSNGVIGLAVLAGLLIWAFDANLDKLIQLYVVGVFTAFTLSQIGMVKHWLKVKDQGGEKARGWRRAIVINGVGAFATAVVLAITAVTKFKAGAWIVIAAMPVIVSFFYWVHSHYATVSRQLRRNLVDRTAGATNRIVLLVPDVGPATAEALGYVRATRPSEFRAVMTSPDGVPPALAEEWRTLCRAEVGLEPLPPGRRLVDRVLAFVRDMPRSDREFVTVVIPEQIAKKSLLSYVTRGRAFFRLKAALLRDGSVVVADAPLVTEGGLPRGVDAAPFVPVRTVSLVFISGVHDASARAIIYARTLHATETRVVFFSMEKAESGKLLAEWAERGFDLPLDVIDAPFRDLSVPLLEEVRRFTAREDTVVSVVIAELLAAKWWHYPLHRHHDLFVKRALLFEPRVILSSVPYALE